MLHYVEELRWRGQLHQTTADEALAAHLARPGRVGYAGFDPTADSLTIGNFITIKLLMLWQQCGHKPVVVMGGGTGLIGDPSGKDAERRLLSREQVEAHIERHRRIFERVLDFDPANPNAAVLVNNADWLGELSFIEVLRDVGKHFSVNAMIQKDSVKTRLEGREQGISYTEFSYALLQAYDFLHLRRTMNCTVQMAGSDQYGNIVGGVDLIRREFGAGAEGNSAAFGVTAPLVTCSDGRKMGKTERGAVWLSADRTSPYQLYQYFVNVDDRDAVPFLKWFTLLPRERIDEIAAEHEAALEQRPAQRALASWMTETLHGAEERARAEQASRALFSGDVGGLDEALLGEVLADVPASKHDRAQLDGEVSLVELLPQTTLAASKREAREFLGAGAVSVNGRKVEAGHAVSPTDLLHGRVILLRRGKKRWHATRWE